MNTETLKIAICDDEKIYRNQLINVIREYCKRHGRKATILEYASGEECLSDLDKMEILFLDIDMEGLDGIEVKEMLEKFHENVLIVFVTNYADRINEAFGMQVVSFIHKPITLKAVTNAMDKILNWYTKRNFIEVEGIDRKKEFFSTEQIYYIEASNQYSKVKLRKEEYFMRKSLTAWEKELKEEGFCRIHQSVIVNFAHVKELGKKVIMDDNSAFTISTRKRKSVEKAYGEYIKEMLSGNV
ncbi:MAG: response regulator transcription factor [Lachnospiraceae bacterium]|nr:response regulator transcription factor [Lachnospiraceae bacterium]